MAKPRRTPAELDSLLKFLLGLCLGSILFFTALGILYALIFVEQPLTGQSENDKMFFNVLGSVATFITGTLAGLLIGKSSSDQQPITFESTTPEDPTTPAVVETTPTEPTPTEEVPAGKPEGEMPAEQDIDEDWDKED